MARRFDAWLRIGLFSLLRYQILSAHLGSPSVPPRLLTHVQLALSARCDLSCEGCYSADDRGGRAPGRDSFPSGSVRTVVVSLGGYYELAVGGPLGLDLGAVLSHRLGLTSLPEFAAGLSR